MRLGFLLDAPDARPIVARVAEITQATLDIINTEGRSSVVVLRGEEFASYEASDTRRIELKTKFHLLGAKAEEMLSHDTRADLWVNRDTAIKQRDATILELKAEVEHLKSTRL
jgi:hypothetical protein